MVLMLSTALAASTAAPRQMTCETSARWRLLDEASLDLDVPEGTTAVSLTVGCRHLGVPGAIIDVGSDPLTTGLRVVGMRRGGGQVYVAATPRQAEALRTVSTPARATLVRDGDWRPLIEAMEQVRHGASVQPAL